MPLYWSMSADSADYSEWKIGRRTTGLIFSAGTFSQKTGGSLGGALSGLYLARIGYLANQEQSATAVEGLRFMMSFLPCLIGALVVVVVCFYPLSPRVVRQIQGDLALRTPT